MMKKVYNQPQVMVTMAVLENVILGVSKAGIGTSDTQTIVPGGD